MTLMLWEFCCHVLNPLTPIEIRFTANQNKVLRTDRLDPTLIGVVPTLEKFEDFLIRVDDFVHIARVYSSHSHTCANSL